MCSSSWDAGCASPPASFAWSSSSDRATNNLGIYITISYVLMSTIISYNHLLQKASQVPFAFMGLRCLASLTSTCSWPPFEVRSDLEATDLMLPPNLRKFEELPVIEEPREKNEDLMFSGGMYFRPTTMSPR